MDPEYLVVLYSKYSPQCQKILQVYDNTTMDYIKLVCIDNSKFRKRLSTSKSFQIKTVPCVLLMYPEDKIEKFEGNNVTDWILQQISQNLPTSDIRRTSIEEEEDVVPPVQQQVEPEPSQQYTSIVDLMDDDEEQQISDSQFIEHGQLRATEAIKRGKSISEIASEMAAAREDADRPAHIKMQEAQQQLL